MASWRALHKHRACFETRCFAPLLSMRSITDGIKKDPQPEEAAKAAVSKAACRQSRRRLMPALVYILRCADNSYYTGTTRGTLENRVAEHNAGHFGGFTAMRRPVALVFHQEFAQITDAIAAERQLKGWSRATKEALIRGDFDMLRELSKRKGDRQ